MSGTKGLTHSAVSVTDWVVWTMVAGLDTLGRLRGGPMWPAPSNPANRLAGGPRRSSAPNFDAAATRVVRALRFSQMELRNLYQVSRRRLGHTYMIVHRLSLGFKLTSR